MRCKKVGSTAPTITANSVSGIPSAANIENPTQTGLKRKLIGLSDLKTRIRSGFRKPM